MTNLPLSVIQNIPSGDSCKSGDDVCRYWAENSEDGGAYCVVIGIGDKTPIHVGVDLTNYKKACLYNK